MNFRTFSGLLLILLLEACASGEPMVQAAQGGLPPGYRYVEVAGVSDATGKKLDFDVAAEVTRQLESRLKDLADPSADPNAGLESRLDLRSELQEYQAGNAFKRWLMPGAGATVCTVRSVLVDKSTGKSLATIIVPKSVSAGGLYSVGADRRIIEAVTEDIASQVRKLLNRQ